MGLFWCNGGVVTRVIVITHVFYTRAIMTIIPYTCVLDELLDFVLAHEKSASKVYKSFQDEKGFDPTKMFAKTQAEAIFSVTRELRRLIQNWDEISGEPILQMYYPENQPSIDAPLQLVK